MGGPRSKYGLSFITLALTTSGLCALQVAVKGLHGRPQLPVLLAAAGSMLGPFVKAFVMVLALLLLLVVVVVVLVLVLVLVLVV